MIFGGKFDRARKLQQEKMEGRERAYDDDGIGSKLEKGDTAALIISAQAASPTCTTRSRTFCFGQSVCYATHRIRTGKYRSPLHPFIRSESLFCRNSRLVRDRKRHG